MWQALRNFNNIVSKFLELRSTVLKKPRCMKCMKVNHEKLNKNIDKAVNNPIFQQYNHLTCHRLVVECTSFEDFLRSYLDLWPVETQSNFKNEDAKIISRYFIDEGKLIEASIIDYKENVEKTYEIMLKLPVSRSFYLLMQNQVEKDLFIDYTLARKQDLTSIVDHIVQRAKESLRYEVDLGTVAMIDSISRMIAFSIVGMETLYPLLLDDNVEEIFLDSPQSTIYINHVQHGRCKTRITLTTTEISRLLGRLRVETNHNINELHPSLKCVINNDLFYARINVDVSPLNFQGFSLDIRRLKKKMFSLKDIMNMKTLNEEIACVLIFLIHAKTNVIITGKTDAGKTTLLNALDMIYPAHFRKVYVEDVVETVKQDPTCSHQLKFQVLNRRHKGDLIKDLLHRSPDILILGEILEQEESEALFHCISTGMKGLQTIHANDPSSLCTRFTIHHRVPPVCLRDLDFIIHMTKQANGRRVITSISEVHVSDDGECEPFMLTQYQTKEERWTPFNFQASKKMEGFFSTSRFTPGSFQSYMKAIQEALRDPVLSRDRLYEQLNQIYISFLNYF